MCQGKFRLVIKKRFFTERIGERWKKLPRSVDMATSLLEFKQHLISTLSHMAYFYVSVILFSCLNIV